MLKRHIVLFSDLIIFAIILLGFTIFQFNDAKYYRQLAESQVANQIELSAINIDAQITEVTSEERVVSQMMANDAFLKQWTEDEPYNAVSAARGGHNAIIDSLYSYLKGFQIKFNYDTVFFVSARTGNYYYQDGFNKTISRDSDFDSWYYNFIALDQEYDIQVDRDETRGYTVSMFVNCVVKNDDGETLGVVGVANHLDSLQNNIEHLCKINDTKIYIVNTANAHNSFSGSTKYFKSDDEVADIFGIDKSVVSSESNTTATSKDGNTCVIVIHNDDLNWNIVVGKNMKSLVDHFIERAYRNSRYLLLILAVFMAGSSILLKRLNDRVNVLQNTDELTGIYNNRLFKILYNKNIHKFIHYGESSFFMLDIDNFKQYNDSKGHLFGNVVLKLVAEQLKGRISDKGIVARWGGDEFIGFCKIPAIELQRILDECNESLQRQKDDMSVSLSIGICSISKSITLEEAIKRADKALYISKERGKKQSTISE